MEARREERIRCNAVGALRWHDSEGQTHYANVRVVNISNNGLGLEAPREVENRCYAHILLEVSGFSAYGTVRHSSRRGTAGIEFNPATICHPRGFSIHQLGLQGDGAGRRQ